jgi:hypothetical protein
MVSANIVGCLGKLRTLSKRKANPYRELLPQARLVSGWHRHRNPGGRMEFLTKNTKLLSLSWSGVALLGVITAVG